MMLILLSILHLYDFIGFFNVSLGSPYLPPPLRRMGGTTPPSLPLKRGGVVRNTFRHLSHQTAQDLYKRQTEGRCDPVSRGERGGWSAENKNPSVSCKATKRPGSCCRQN